MMDEALIQMQKELMSEADLVAFEALGTLVLCGAEESADAWCKQEENFRDRAARALDSLDPDELDDAALEFSLAIERLREAADDDTTDLEERIVDSLAVRNRVEIILAGIERATGEEPQLSDELGSAVDSFDEIAEDRLERLSQQPRFEPFERRLKTRKKWALPVFRKRLW